MEKREIKFRVWDGDKMNYTPRASMYLEFINDEFYLAESSQISKVFMQYTGLKDRNGKEIWEGDYLRSRAGMVKEVVWGDGCWMWGGEPLNMSEGEMIPGYSEEWAEVVGNLYEGIIINSEKIG